jgi:hypothetical protein
LAASAFPALAAYSLLLFRGAIGQKAPFSLFLSFWRSKKKEKIDVLKLRTESEDE